MLLVAAQVIALIIAAIVIAKSYVSFRAGHETKTMFIFWTLTWVAIILIAFFPDAVTAFLGEKKIGTGTFFGVGLIFVYFVLYRVYSKADRIERELDRLVRRLSIEFTNERADATPTRPPRRPTPKQQRPK